MMPDLNSDLRVALFEVAATYWRSVEAAGSSTAHGTLASAVVAILNRVDEVLLALPTPEDLRLALVDRHPFLGDTREGEADAGRAVQLDADAAAELCGAICAHDEALTALLERIRTSGAPGEHGYFQKLIGSVIYEEYAEVLAPLWAQHPELARASRRPPDA